MGGGYVPACPLSYVCLIVTLACAALPGRSDLRGPRAHDRGLLPHPDDRQRLLLSQQQVGHLHRHDPPRRARRQQQPHRLVARPIGRLGRARRVQHEGKDVSNPTWADDGWLQVTADRPAVEDRSRQRRRRFPCRSPAALRPLAAADAVDAAGAGDGEGGTPSPDGNWDVAAVNKPRDEAKPAYASEFEKRHQERFKGVIFDWKDFQRDGAEFPAPNPVAQPAQQVVVRPRPASETTGRAESSRGHGSAPGEPGLASEWPDHRVHRRP